MLENDMDIQTFGYIESKFYNLILNIEKKPAAFAGECSLPLVAEEIRNIIKAVQYVFGVKIDFELKFKEYVLEYYGKHYYIKEKNWSYKSWDEIICFFHFFKEHALQQFFSVFREFVERSEFNTEISDCNIIPLEKSGKEILKKYIDEVEKEPEKYLNTVSLKNFFSSIKALEYVIYFFSGKECFDFFDGFLEYVCIFYSEKYGIVDSSFFGSRNWGSIISFFSKNDKEAFYNFFVLYENFDSKKIEKDYKKIWEHTLFSL